MRMLEAGAHARRKVFVTCIAAKELFGNRDEKSALGKETRVAWLSSLILFPCKAADCLAAMPCAPPTKHLHPTCRRTGNAGLVGSCDCSLMTGGLPRLLRIFLRFL